MSVFDMLRNSMTIFIALFSFSFKKFRVKFDLPQLIGLIVLTCGLILTGIVSIVRPQESASHPLLGAIFCITYAFFCGLYYCAQELLIGNLDVNASLGVSFEGFWGLIFLAIIVPIANRTKNPFNEGHLRIHFEDSAAWAYQISHSKTLVILSVFYIAASLLFNMSGLETTKNTSSSIRTTFSAATSFVIWMASFALKWEKFDKVETPIKGVGFLVAFTGILIYANVLLIIPFIKEINKHQFWGTQMKDLAAD